MAEPFTFKAVHSRFHCGSENPHVQLINLLGPKGAKATAYSCSMNVDVDGEPQCYGPATMRPIPRDSLQDAGWLSPAKNAEKKAAYDADFPAAKQLLTELTEKRHSKDIVPDHAAKLALDKQIHDVKLKLHKLNPFYASNAVKNGTVFWHWYGVYAMSHSEAQHAVFDDRAHGLPARRPIIDETKPELCDVNGKYPVIQSKLEPGPGYYVSPISRGTNTTFPKWDQRFYLPADVVSSNDPVQPPFGALSSGLSSVSGVAMRDQVLAVNRGTGISLAFPFMDGAYGNKVAECSLSAFLKLGGKEKDRRHWDNSKLELLYIAFPNKQAPSDALRNFAGASNASDFPVLLAFLAGTRGASDATAQFKRWQDSTAPGPRPKPPYYDVIEAALRVAGFNA